MEPTDLIAPTLGLLAQFAKYRSCKKPPFILQRIDDRGTKKIRLQYVSKNIEKCTVFFDTNPLSWDRLKVNTAEKTIGEGGGGNTVIPNSIFHEEGIVTVTFDGQKTVKKYLEIVEADP